MWVYNFLVSISIYICCYTNKDEVEITHLYETTLANSLLLQTIKGLRQPIYSDVVYIVSTYLIWWGSVHWVHTLYGDVVYIESTYIHYSYVLSLPLQMDSGSWTSSQVFSQGEVLEGCGNCRVWVWSGTRSTTEIHTHEMAITPPPQLHQCGSLVPKPLPLPSRGGAWGWGYPVRLMRPSLLLVERFCLQLFSFFYKGQVSLCTQLLSFLKRSYLVGFWWLKLSNKGGLRSGTHNNMYFI